MLVKVTGGREREREREKRERERERERERVCVERWIYFTETCPQYMSAPELACLSLVRFDMYAGKQTGNHKGLLLL